MCWRNTMESSDGAALSTGEEAMQCIARQETRISLILADVVVKSNFGRSNCSSLMSLILRGVSSPRDVKKCLSHQVVDMDCRLTSRGISCFRRGRCTCLMKQLQATSRNFEVLHSFKRYNLLVSALGREFQARLHTTGRRSNAPLGVRCGFLEKVNSPRVWLTQSTPV